MEVAGNARKAATVRTVDVRRGAISRGAVRASSMCRLTEHCDVDAAYVREHAELGAIRRGDGPKARRRFSLAEQDARLTTRHAGRWSSASDSAAQARSRRRRRRSLGTNVELLPIRGQIGDRPGA
jgi:hypothetical protein